MLCWAGMAAGDMGSTAVQGEANPVRNLTWEYAALGNETVMA